MSDDTTKKTATAKASETTAAEREADDSIEKIEFTAMVKGKEMTFTAPADFDDLPFDAALLMENQKYMNALAEVLGNAQMTKLRAQKATRKDLSEVFMKLNEAWGLGED